MSGEQFTTTHLDPRVLAVEILKETRRTLAVPSAWVQRSGACDKYGREVPTGSAQAVCWCLLGAVDNAYFKINGTSASYTLATEALRTAAQTTSLIGWNDRPVRTLQEVQRVVQEALSWVESRIPLQPPNTEVCNEPPW